MSDTVIRVENLGKKYIIGHQQQERYTALQDVITNLKEADVTQTRFYQEVLEIGEKKGLQQGVQQGLQQGVQQGEANLTIRQLKRRCGNLTAIQEQKVRSLSISQLESLGEALLDFQNMSDLENWLQDNRRLS